MIFKQIKSLNKSPLKNFIKTQLKNGHQNQIKTLNLCQKLLIYHKNKSNFYKQNLHKINRQKLL